MFICDIHFFDTTNRNMYSLGVKTWIMQNGIPWIGKGRILLLEEIEKHGPISKAAVLSRSMADNKRNKQVFVLAVSGEETRRTEWRRCNGYGTWEKGNKNVQNRRKKDKYVCKKIFRNNRNINNRETSRYLFSYQRDIPI